MNKIALVTTGGTIDKDYFDALSEYQIAESVVPELIARIGTGIELTVYPLLRKDSLELTDLDRAKIVDTVSALTEDKVLITHGTDTMVHTASQLQEAKLDKTIVITGAMKPARFQDTDAVFNVGVAVGALQAAEQGVYIAMSAQVFVPNAVVKDRAAQQFVAK
jgi:L-asparaginase